MPIRDRSRSPTSIQLLLQASSIRPERGRKILAPDLKVVVKQFIGHIAVVGVGGVGCDVHSVLPGVRHGVCGAPFVVEKVRWVVSVASVDDEGGEALFAVGGVFDAFGGVFGVCYRQSEVILNSFVVSGVEESARGALHSGSQETI